jgi:Tfp pilus assembly protein PilF
MNRRGLRTTCIALTLLAALLGVAACGGGKSKKEQPTTPQELSTQDKVRMAQSMLSAGRTGDAMQLLEQALADEPDSAQLHLFYGKISFQAGKFADAEAAFRKAIELDPYLTDAHNFLGAAYAEQGKNSEAEQEYLAALADPAYTSPEMVYLNLALLYSSQGRALEAIESLRNAVEINPRFYKAHFELASLLDSEGNLDEAAREYEVATPGFRTVGEFHYRLGFVYFRLGEKSKARDALERAIDVAPGSNSAAQAGELLKLMK